MTPTERELLERAIAKFGIPNQILKALEEMTELSAELWRISKKCINDGPEHLKVCVVRSFIREEIADVRIMIDQLEMIFGDTSSYRREKLERLKARIAE